MDFELRREFHVGDVLAVFLDRNISNRGLDAHSDLLGYIAGDPDIRTLGEAMQMPRVREEILRQCAGLDKLEEFPDLSLVESAARKDVVKKWLDRQIAILGTDTFCLRPAEVNLALSDEEETDYAQYVNPNIKVLNF